MSKNRKARQRLPPNKSALSHRDENKGQARPRRDAGMGKTRPHRDAGKGAVRRRRGRPPTNVSEGAVLAASVPSKGGMPRAGPPPEDQTIEDASVGGVEGPADNGAEVPNKKTAHTKNTHKVGDIVYRPCTLFLSEKSRLKYAFQYIIVSLDDSGGATIQGKDGSTYQVSLSTLISSKERRKLLGEDKPAEIRKD